eukprot:scpid39867/ scgid5289/ 
MNCQGGLLVVALALCAIAITNVSSEHLEISCAKDPVTPSCNYVGEDAVYTCAVRGTPNLVTSVLRNSGRAFTSSQVGVQGGVDVSIKFARVSLADNDLIQCVEANTAHLHRRACFKLKVCPPDFVHCHTESHAPGDNCTRSGWNAQYHCRARGTGLSVHIDTPLCDGKVRVQQATGGKDIFFLYPRANFTLNGLTQCFSAATTRQQQTYCFTLSICKPEAPPPPFRWNFLPATLGAFGRFSIARSNRPLLSYGNASSLCSSIGYRLPNHAEIFAWRKVLRSALATVQQDFGGPFYLASQSARPELVYIDDAGYVVNFGHADDPTRPYPYFCVVLCDNGFVDRSVPNAAVCRCLPGWVGKRCENRAFASYTNTIGHEISLWLAPDSGCTSRDESPSQCAQHGGRHGWRDAQAACASLSMSIASTSHIDRAGWAFHNLASRLVLAGYHQQLSVWLNRHGVKSLYSVSRSDLRPRVSTTGPNADPASDVICESKWKFITISYGGYVRSARVAIKTSPLIRGSQLSIVPELCAAMNMTIPLMWSGSDNYKSLFLYTLPRLEVRPPFLIPVRISSTYTYVARISPPEKYSLLPVNPGAFYKPVCIRVCPGGQRVNQYNECT